MLFATFHHCLKGYRERKTKRMLELGFKLHHRGITSPLPELMRFWSWKDPKFIQFLNTICCNRQWCCLFSFPLLHRNSECVGEVLERYRHCQFRAPLCTYHRKGKQPNTIIHYTFIAYYSFLKAKLWQRTATVAVATAVAALPGWLVELWLSLWLWIRLLLDLQLQLWLLILCYVP